MPLSLTMLVSGERRMTFTDADLILVGRDPHCDIVIPDRLVSREHCRFERRDRRWSVVDTSRNGTFAGASRIDAHSLAVGEPVLLRLGDRDAGPTVTVQVVDGEPAAPPPAPGLDVVATHPFGAAPLSIGRVAGNDVVVDDLLVARHHATVALAAPGVAVVTHLAGRNGTFVNGLPAGRQAMRSGDRLAVGRCVFTYDGATSLIQHSADRQAALAARNLSVRHGTHQALDDVSFTLGAGSLVAVIGPSGAGKSTLLRALTGVHAADEGHVLVDGIDFYPAFDEVRHRVGLVPQEDVLHDQLTVAQALRHAAALRLPDDIPAEARERRVDTVITQLDLTAQRDSRIDRLSGGQRKRASVAMELLTEPSLLYLDEPTSGLDPLLDREVTRQLRQLADRGRTVVVVTHSTANLDFCHTVIAMARGGRVAYAGPPGGLLPHFGARDFADVFTALTEEATSWALQYTATTQGERQARPATAPPPIPPRQSAWRQVGLLLRRSVQLLLADRRQQLMVFGMPFLLASVVQTAPSSAELRWEPVQTAGGAGMLLVILVLGAAFMGMAGSIRELVGERSIYRREWAVGLRPGAYLGAKVLVSALLSAMQAAVLGSVGLIGRAVPQYGLVLANARLELMAVLALTAFTAAMAGLLASAFAKRVEHTMTMLVVTVMAQLVLSGGLFSIGGRPWLQALAVVSPTRWGFAAAAATVDLGAFGIMSPPDALWRHTAATWWGTMGALAVLGAAFALLTRTVLRRQEPRPRAARTSADSPGRTPAS